MAVLGGMLRALARRAAMKLGINAVIAVDSVTVEKRYGPKLVGIRPVYDPTKKKLVDGFEIVSSCVAGKDTTVPVGFVPHHKAPTPQSGRRSNDEDARPKRGSCPANWIWLWGWSPWPLRLA